MRRAVMIAAIVAISLGFTVTAYAVARQIIQSVDFGGYRYVTSDEHFIEPPSAEWQDAWQNFLLEADERARDSETPVVHKYARAKVIEYTDLQGAFDFIGSEFNIPDSFGLYISRASMSEDLFLGSRGVSIHLDSKMGIQDDFRFHSYNLQYFISTAVEDDFHVTIGMPGTIVELVINGATVHRMVVSGESLGIKDYPFNLVTMMWEHDGLFYRTFCTDGVWTLEDLETLVAGILP